MPRAEGVVLAFRALEKSGEAVFLAQGVHASRAAREHLVRIALVADVPHELVARGVERVVQGDGEFHDAEPRADVAAGHRARLDEEGAHVIREHAHLVVREGADVGG